MDASLGISVINGQKFDCFDDNGHTYEYFNGLPLFTQKNLTRMESRAREINNYLQRTVH
jgi:hypothetical protein